MKRIICAVVFMLLISGCSFRSFSTTPRTAVEQLLLSRAVDLALEKFELPEFNGKTVYVDTTNLKAYDVEYIRVAVRARICELGGRLCDKADGADMVAEVASGALGLEHKKTLVGIPPIPVPNSPTAFPELSIFRTVEQSAIMKLLIFVHSDGKFVASNLYYAKADRDESFLLWFRFQRTDNVREGWQRADLKISKPPSQP